MKRIHKIAWAFVVLSASVHAGAEPDESPARDPARPGAYVGLSSCANGFCHGAIEPLGETAVLQNEYPTWMLGPHRESYQTLFDDSSQEIAETLEGPGAKASEMKVCLDCHVLNVRAEEIYVEDGISCEACHGAAGGWRDRHFEEGWTYPQSLRAGMTDLRDPVTRGEVCLTCHLGDAERKVDHRLIAAGHPRLFFELDNATGAMPRHWKVRKAGHGVRAWATGQAITFRESLEQLARHASGAGTWPEFSEYNCQSCHHSLAGSEWRRQPGYRFAGGMPRWSAARWVVLRNLIGTFAAGELEGFDAALDELARQVRRMRDPGAVAAQARELAVRVDDLTARLSKVRWSQDDAAGMMRRLAADRDAFLADVAAAEQLAFALQSLMGRRVELDRRLLESPLAAGIDAVFAALEDPDAFDRKHFASLLQHLETGGRPDLTAAAAAAREEAGAPALGLMVARDGEEPRVAVDGVRLMGEDAAVSVDDKWHWGSVTKSMTATLVARLVEKGTVSWDDAVGARLGKAVPEMRDAYRDVTFRHLLAHRGGLQPNIPLAGFFGQNPADPIADRLKWVRLALKQEPVGPKGETYVYSNNGYVVAGAMLEAATGESWEDLMRREVFAPLGIEDAGFGPPKGDQPRGHRPVAGADQPVPADADNPAALGPAGRVHMPLADMARFLLAHARKRPDFLSSESYEALRTASFGGNYAMGWVAITPDSRWHNGSNTMWYAEVIFSLVDDTVAAVVVNDGEIGSVQGAVRALLGKLMKNQE